MAASWTVEETRTLISVWGQANVHSDLDGVQRNRKNYEAISNEIGRLDMKASYIDS